MSASDIFFSYAREDQARVALVVAALEARGWSVFWDRRIPAGKTWRKHIGQALEQARCVIVAWSKHSIQADWVIEEADDGRERNILVPLFLDPVRPPRGFRGIQTADLSSWSPERQSPEFNYLLADLAAMLGSAPIQTKLEDTDDFAAVLSQTINEDTLSYYTKWKFPNIPNDPQLQKKLLEDLAFTTIETLDDLDLALNSAADAVDQYRKESPDLFTASTDFLTKSLGFVDKDFRARHGFSPQTKKAFLKYEHLLRPEKKHAVALNKKGQAPVRAIEKAPELTEHIRVQPRTALLNASSETYSAFIFYSQKDVQLARQLKEILTQRGISCWFAEEDLELGESILTSISRALTASRFALICIGKHGLDAFQQSEWNTVYMAAQAGKILAIPVYLGTDSPIGPATFDDPFFNGLKACDLRQRLEGNPQLEVLIERLGGRTAGGRERP